MVLRKLSNWLVYALIAVPALGQEFRRNIVAIRPESSSSPVGQLRFYEATTPTNYVGFKAPASVASNVVFELPGVDGSAGNCLGYASAATLGWVPCASGGSGLTSLNGQLGGTQTFANDTNITIVSASNAHTLTWSGTLAKARQHAATVYNDASNTYTTGTQSFVSATALLIPAGAGSLPTAAAAIAYNSTTNKVGFGNGTTTKIVATEDGNIATASALLVNPTACSGGQFVTDIDADGTLVCGTPAGGGNVSGPGSTTQDNVPQWDATLRQLKDGLPVSLTGAANSIPRSDGFGTITTGPLITKDTAAINFQNSTDDPAMLVFRSTDSSPVSPLIRFRNRADNATLSEIDKDGNFTGRAATALALSVDPTACPGGQFVTDINAAGTLTCAAGSGNVTGPGSSTNDYVVVWNGTSGSVLSGGYPRQTTTPTANAVLGTDSNKAFTAYDKGGQVYNVKAYGAAGTGGDDTSAIGTALAACEDSTYGGSVFFPSGVYGITAQRVLGNGSSSANSTKAICRLEGVGSGSEDTLSGGNFNASVIKWTGSNPGSDTYMFKYAGPMIGGGGMSNIGFDCNSNARVLGLDLASINFFHFQNVSVMNCGGGGSGGAFSVKIHAVRSGAGHFACYNTVTNMKVRPYVNSVGSALWLGGDSSLGTACKNIFTGGYFNRDNNYTSGTNTATYGVLMDSSDNNTFFGVHFSNTGGNGSRNGCTIGAEVGNYTPGFGLFPYPDSSHLYAPSSNGFCGTTGTGGRPWVIVGGECGSDGQGNCDGYAGLSGSKPVFQSGEGDRKLWGVSNVGSVGSTGGYYWEDRATAGSTRAWEWYATADVARLYSHGTGTAPLTVKYDASEWHHNRDSGDQNIYATVGSSTSTHRSALILQKYRGTIASPSAVQSGDTLGAIAAFGHNGASTSPYVRINLVADGVSSGTPTDSTIRFATTDGSLNDSFWINGKGMWIPKRTYTASDLSSLTKVAGATVWCSDCGVAATCATGGAGHWAVSNNAASAWTCQ